MTLEKRPVMRWLLPALLCYLAGFVAASFFDFAIDRAIYTPDSLFAVWMECFGWYPAFLPPLFLAALLATAPGPARKGWWQRVAGAAVLLGGFCGLYYASYGYMIKRTLLFGPADPAAWVWLAAGVLFFGLFVFFSWRISPGLRQRLVFFALVGTVFLVLNLAIINPVKMLWARTRFDDMLALGDFSAFTPWYRPFGNGGNSFPSGHTANAAGILSLLLLCDLFPSWEKRRRLVLALCWVWIIAMAFARILIGRHFLSDTLAASALVAVLFYALRHNRWYRRGLGRVLAGDEAGGTGGEASDAV